MRSTDAPRAADVRTALNRQIAEAVLGLSGPISDEAVHATRKKLKSARAKLRLLRGAVGRNAYARENVAFRDAGRPLSHARDSRAVLDTIEALLLRKSTRARRLLLTALRGRVEQTHAAARADLESGPQVSVTAQALRRASQRIAQWDVPQKGRAGLKRAVKRIYRAARKALTAVQADASADNLHELRKQVKYLREALTPIDGHPVRGAAGIVKRADALATALGNDRDLYVLEQKLSVLETALHTHSVSLAAEIAEERAALQKRALKRAGKLLRKKPRAFARRLKIR